MEKTPICQAIEKLKSYIQDDVDFIAKYEKDATPYYHNDYVRAMDAVEQTNTHISILTELLPKEKEMVEKAYDDGWTNCNQKKFDGSERYFNENYTQK